MSQTLAGLYNKEDVKTITDLEEMIQEAEIELQKALTMYNLEISIEEAFKVVFEMMDKMQEVALRSKGKDTQFVVINQVSDFSSHFKETIKQIQTN